MVNSTPDLPTENVTYSTLCVKNDTALACHNFDGTILIIFDRNVAKKVSSPMVLYFPTSPN